MSFSEQAPPKTEIALTINGQAVRVPEGTSLYDAARQLGIEIPVLCHHSRLAPVGVCRLCVVDVGERVLVSACTRACSPGMNVRTDTPEITGHRRVLTALLLSDYPERSRREETSGDDALLSLGRSLGVEEIPFPDGLAAGAFREKDDSSPVIAVDHQACILCDRCIRACADLQHNDVIGRTGKGYSARIAFDLNQPMGHSRCVSCGECMAVCPTGALTDKTLSQPWRIRKS